MTAPTATRKTSTRRHALRLPRLGWGWLLVAAIAFGIAKTWPVITATTVVLLAIGLITAARQPAWLQRATRRLPAIGTYRSVLHPRGRRTLADFQRMNPTRFEHAIAELAREDHDHVAHATTVGGSNDRGADVLVTLHTGHRIMIQCKRYVGHNVTSEDVQKTNGTYHDIHGCHAAIIVTTAGFTRDAQETNRLLGHRILLIGGHQLEAWANGYAPAPW